MQELENRIARLESKVNQMVRVGVVSSVQADAGTVRVKLSDSDGMISRPLPVLFRKTQDNKAYDMPDIGEQVICLFLPIGLEQGFVLGSPYSSQDQPPVSDNNKTHYRFEDGSLIEYDRGSHTLTLNIAGNVKATAQSFEFNGPATFKDDVTVEGDINATGQILDTAGNTNHHTH